MEGSILEHYKNILDPVPCGICQVALDDDLTIHQSLMDKIGSGKTKFQLEYRGVHRSGMILWLLVQCIYAPNRPESRWEYIDFYESIIQGKPKGQTVVKKRRRDGTSDWYSAKFAVIYDSERRNGLTRNGASISNRRLARQSAIMSIIRQRIP